MSALPGCPKCGHVPAMFSLYGHDEAMQCVCGFLAVGAEMHKRYPNTAAQLLVSAVTRELAEQALALRAASGVREDGRWINLSAARNAVINDYALLCANPLTLTIGGGDE